MELPKPDSGTRAVVGLGACPCDSQAPSSSDTDGCLKYRRHTYVTVGYQMNKSGFWRKKPFMHDLDRVESKLYSDSKVIKLLQKLTGL